MKRKLTEQIEKYGRDHNRRNMIVSGISLLSICTFLVVCGVMRKPAISMEGNPLLTASPAQALMEEELSANITAEGKEDGMTYFYLSVEKDQAGLTDAVQFDEYGVAVIMTNEGKQLELHLEENGTEDIDNYWFSVEVGQKVSFSLPFEAKMIPATTETPFNATRVPEEETTVESAEVLTEGTTEETAEASTEEMMKETTEAYIEKITEETAEASTEEITERPAEVPTEELIDESVELTSEATESSTSDHINTKENVLSTFNVKNSLQNIQGGGIWRS